MGWWCSLMCSISYWYELVRIYIYKWPYCFKDIFIYIYIYIYIEANIDKCQPFTYGNWKWIHGMKIVVFNQNSKVPAIPIDHRITSVEVMVCRGNGLAQKRWQGTTRTKDGPFHRRHMTSLGHYVKLLRCPNNQTRLTIYAARKKWWDVLLFVAINIV